MLNQPGDYTFRNKQFLVCVKVYWSAIGVSKAGMTVYRDKKPVECGHEHKAEMAAKECMRKMRLTRPGNCRHYTASVFTEWKPVSPEEHEKLLKKNARKIAAFIGRIAKQGGVRLEYLQDDIREAESLGITWSEALSGASPIVFEKLRARRKTEATV